MVRQEVYRKQGYAVQADEEQLRVQLENLQAELNAPMQFKVNVGTSVVNCKNYFFIHKDVGKPNGEQCPFYGGNTYPKIFHSKMIRKLF